MSVERNFAVGIDLGSVATKACIAQIPRPGQAPGPSKIVLNDVSNRETPTVVTFDADHRLIGEPAKSAVISNGKNTCTLFPFALSFLGDANEEAALGRFATHECEVAAANGTCTFQPVHSPEPLSVAQVTLAFLSSIKKFAMDEVAQVHEAATVTAMALVVPDSASHLHRLNLAKVCTALGCKYHLIESSRVLGHSYVTKHKPEESRTVLFVDMGECMTETSLVSFGDKASGNKVTVKAKGAGPQALGTADLVEVIADMLRTTLLEKHNCKLTPKTKDWARLQKAANKALEVLSANKTTLVTLESFAGDRDFQIEIVREAFEEKCVENQIAEKLTKIIMDCQNNVKTEDIFSVELVGGGSRIPFVKQTIQAHYGERVRATLDGSIALAQGAVELLTSGGLDGDNDKLTEAEAEDATRLQDCEATFEARDTGFRAIGEQKNEFESRIYKLRDIVTSQGDLFDDKDSVLQQLQSTEDFLFENWDNLTLESIEERSKGLEALWDSNSTRYMAKLKADEAQAAKEEAQRVTERLAEEAAAGPKDYDTRKLKTPERMKKVTLNKVEGNDLLRGGQCRLAISHYDKALAHCDKFFDLSPEDEKEVAAVKVSLHNNTAQAHVKLKQWKKVIEAADKALSIEAGHIKARYRKAMGLDGLNDHKAAIAVLKEALDLSPTDSERKALDSLLVRVTGAKVKQDERSKKVFSKMFG